MNSNFSKKRNRKPFLKKGFIFFVSLMMVFSLITAPKPALAQGPVIDFANLIQNIKDFFDTKVGKIIQKAGSVAYQRTLSNALNKIAYDAANYIGSGDEGQKPLYVTEGWGTYLKNIGDEAAGDYLESFVRNLNSDDDQSSCEERTYNCYNECYEIEYGEPFPDDVSNDDVFMESRDLLDFSDNENTISCVEMCEKAATSCSGREASLGTSRVIDDGSDYNSFNVCQPSSIEAKLKISLGLSSGTTREAAPNCTGSDIINNWGDGIEGVYDKIANIQDGSLFENIDDYFNPGGNDLSIYLMADTDLSKKTDFETEVKVTDLKANGGWLTVENIAGTIEGTPNAAQKAEEEARAIRIANFGKTTGDIVVDAANIFLNQAGINAYNYVMRKLTDKSDSEDVDLTDYSGDSNTNSESRMKEKTQVLIEPQFQSKSDYSILTELSSCPDPEYPGYNYCVINDGFMQAVNEGLTVGEAISQGYLNKNWRIEKDYYNNAYNDHFSLRNVKILRKYRILPLGWEVAIERAFENENNFKDATLGDLVSCFDEFDEYDNYSSSFEVLNNDWCEGLVDPNWVLKAPLNYCQKEGSGSQILTSLIMPGIKDIDYTSDTLSELMVLRDDNYCADNQSCIKEGEKGSCDLYGYCTEEKRTWNFEGSSCSPIANTCQLFTNTDTNSKISYLQNTIDYAECNVDNAGCKLYSYNGEYDAETNNISWDINSSLNLNNNLNSCSNSSQGCSEMLRVKPTWGNNLIIHPSFGTADSYLTDWSYRGDAVLIEDMSSEIYGQANYQALQISGDSVVYMSSTNKVFPKDLQILANQNYTISADVYLETGDYVTAAINPGDYQETKTISTKGAWTRISVTGSSNYGLISPSFRIGAYSQGLGEVNLYVKNIKFELGDWATTYTGYGYSKVYQKIIPDYLESSCYLDVSSAEKDYTLKTDAPSICSNYTKKCNASEVGCNLYTGVYSNLVVPAQVSSYDYCANECVGYDMYIARASYLNPAETENIIPANSEKCSLSAVGCNEFTNLDSLEEGGENKEYYISLKHCIKPDENKCGEFYTWENGVAGDLTRYTLEKDEYSNPLTVGNFDEGDCSEIYNLLPSDPNYNPDCRQFINTEGEISYKLYSKVVTCSDNCYSYRLSGQNIDKNIRTQEACENEDNENNNHWNDSAEQCYVCKNGGVWSDNNSACIYQAIPEEGVTCSAQNNGCREYNGSNGSNTRIVAAFDFEDGYDSWYSNCSDGIDLSLISNSQKGQSLLYNADASDCDNSDISGLVKRVFAGDNQIAKLNIGSDVNKDMSYTLRFIARSEVNTSINIYFQNSNNDEKYYFNSSLDTEEAEINVKGGGSWHIYNVSLGNLNEEIGSNGTLNISGSNSILIDNITLTEITDRYYLKKNTSNIPNVCYYDNLGEYQGSNYNLGCTLYKDKDNLSHSLHNFSNLCSLDSVGCEQMIYTNNYSSPDRGIWNDLNDNGECDNDEEDCVEVERDTAMYVVYNRTMSCASSEAGCSLLGQSLGEGQDRSWTNVSKINDPDTYSDALCLSKDVNCDEYKLDSGSYTYFKNPGDNVCVYKVGNSVSNQKKDWYKSPVKRCDYNGNDSIEGEEMTSAICSSDLDCGDISKCITDNNDYPCSTSYFKTIGLGGTGGAIAIPDTMTALCESSSSGCTEYIDPVSQFNPNLVINSQHKASENGSYTAWGDDTWLGGGISEDEQVIQIERNKLYSIVVTAGDDKLSEVLNTELSIEFARKSVRLLQEDNNFSPEPLNEISVDYSEKPIIFNSFDNYSILLFRENGLSDDFNIEVREVSVNYQFEDNINKSDCSGITDFDEGCILFNERKINSASGFSTSIYNAFQTEDKSSPSLKGSSTANQLIKVTPDRTCAKWLTCTSYGIDDNGDTQCYSLGECNMLDEKNECVNVIEYSEGEKTTFDPDKNRNSSGYALLDKNYYSNIKEVGLNTTIHYNFEDTVPSLSCVKENGKVCIFDDSISQDLLVREPEGAPTDYPAEGKSYLKVNPGQFVSPHGKGAGLILPEIGKYYLNFLINTKDSGGEALIGLELNGETTNYPVQSLFGWKREIIELNTSVINTKLNIYLSSRSEYSVYFDDINIEPVLELVEGDHVAKDCRLYPTSESLSCYENDDSVIRNGLEGYCLEYDLANPDICQQWLPVDKISSSQLPSANLGYSGKSPLTYCAEVDSNFLLLEKRKAAIVKEEIKHRNNGDYQGVRSCYYPSTQGDYCFNMIDSDDGYITVSNQTVPQGFVFGVLNTISNSISSVFNWIFGGDSSSDTDSESSSEATVEQEELGPDDYKEISKASTDSFNPDVVKEHCGDSGNYFLLKTQELKEERGFLVRDEIAITYICMPIASVDYYADKRTSRIVVETNPELINLYDDHNTILPFTNGWYPADGFHTSSGMATKEEDSAANGFNELANDSNSPLRVWDMNYAPPASEEDLKKISSKSPDEVFRLTCNKFIEVVTSSGENVAQVERVVNNLKEYQIEPKNTYKNYVRNIGDIPYGAASWPTDFNLTESEKIPLYNQYSSKNNEDVFAGRPYGCVIENENELGISNLNKANCSMIGYCDGNPDVYCLVDSGLSPFTNSSQLRFDEESAYDISRFSCGINGTCTPLWANESFAEIESIGGDSYENALSQLFLKSFNAYEYLTDSGGYSSVAGYDKSSVSGNQPEISNINVYYGDTEKKVEGDSLKAGNYRLEFNTEVDPNQQPLKQIIIDWGDDYKQVVIDQDHRPYNLYQNRPHVLYHYYSNADNINNINVRIIDNWGESSDVMEFYI